MRPISDTSIARKINEFVESLKNNVHTIQVITEGNETIIYYEEYEHPPIINYEPTLLTSIRRKSEEARLKMSEARKGKEMSPETKQKLSKALKGKERSEIHSFRISKAKLKYYDNLRNGKKEDIH